MRVLVVGAGGQIGGAVATALRARGDEVTVLARRPLPGWDTVVGDITDAGLEIPKVEAVIQAAGVVSYWPRAREQLFRVNVEGSANVLDAARRAGVRRFVLTSSIATIGAAERGLADEDTPWAWSGLGIDYFEAKLAAEQRCLAATGVEVVVVNPAITFGPGELKPAAGRMILQVLAGGPPGIPPGTTTAASLDDVVAGHLAALDHGRPGRRYILGGHPMPFVELYQRISAVLGVPAPTRVLGPVPLRLFGQLQRLRGWWTGVEPAVTPAIIEISLRNRGCSSARAERELGYQISPLEPAIAACAEDWRRRMAVPQLAAGL